MNNGLQSPPSEPQQPQGHVDRVTRLDQCADVLTIADLCAVLRISQAQYFHLKAHAAFPIEPLPSLGGAVRYSKASVARYLERGAPVKVRRIS